MGTGREKAIASIQHFSFVTVVHKEPVNKNYNYKLQKIKVVATFVCMYGAQITSQQISKLQTIKAFATFGY